MRVVIAADAMAGLTPADASALIAGRFAERGAVPAVVPLAVTGDALAHAVATAAPGAPFARPADAVDLGRALADADGDLVVDLTACRVADLGRGVLDAFADDPVEAVAVARQAWSGRRLVALVEDGQQERPLTGLTGLAATEGREHGADLADVLAADAVAGRWATSLGLTAQPGAGAAGGAGLLLQAMGAVITDPLTFLVEHYGLAGTMAQADLVVTGADMLDFHAVGGPVVKRIVGMAGEALRPVIAIVGRNYVSSRELRLAGLEAAYPVLAGAGDDIATPGQVAEVAERVARTWSW
ncbi:MULTISPECIES: glycerate kinase [Tessaracoccus]|nr:MULTISPECIES: glycerate kinase [Tessaracoccus]AQX16661.1 hypothetical protein BKM78_12635 [Tessaracoccus sp. T2.5-30]VEP41381.1 hypothetical protein TLA_TLA_02544 [Tessaracoccus lapidicaptus]